MKTLILTVFGILFLAGFSAAVDRQIAHTDLNAVPAPGESEIVFKSLNHLWYVVSMDGKPLVQVEPGIPEKIIVNNGYNKLKIQPSTVSKRGRIINYGINSGIPIEIVIEAMSDSTTVEITASGFLKASEAKIVETRPLNNARPAAQTAPVPASASAAPAKSSAATGIEGALEKAAEQTLRNVTQRSKIAIVYITAQDRSTTDYIAGELEFIWVNEGFILIDRSQLDRLRREQDFQMSGEIDDETAVSIGKFAGADIIVTGKIDGEGSLRRLRLRALDTQTAQVVGAASEAF
ncbi:MAG: CsgG/HfaB family protein [Treponema sp.]|jgi:hypothetical protein|nr:CsgG/HfaB family protein [Treponema sp.]